MNRRLLIISLLVAGWFFSGWPNIPEAHAALNITKGTFTVPASTGTQTITVGFEPKLVFFWYGNHTTTGSFQADAAMGYGWAVSPTQRYAFGVTADDAIVKNEAKPRLSNSSAIVQITDENPGTVVFEADLAESFATTGTGFKLDWTTVSSGKIIHYMALGGGAISNVYSGDFTAGGATGNVSETNVGFQPDYVQFISDGKGTSFPSTNGKSIMVGHAVSSTSRAATSVAYKGQEGAAGKAGGSQRTDRAIIAEKGNGTEMEADFVSMDADGFTVNVTKSKNNFIIPYLAIKGANLKIALGADTQKTSAGTKATTGLGFQPQGLMFYSWNNTASASSVADAKLTIGGSDGTNEGALWAGNEDNPTTDTKADTYINTTKALMMGTPGATPSLDAEADVNSFDSDGFTLDWTTADATARQFIYLGFGTDSPGPPTLYSTGGSVQLAFNNAKINDDTPTFRVAATDPSSDPVDYRIEIDDDSAFGSINWTIDFDNGGSHYTSGSQVNLTCSTITGLTDGTTYYIRAKAIDTTGSNIYGPYSSGTWSFTYNATSGAGPMWFQTTDEQFDTGTLSNTQTTGSDSVELTTSPGTITSPSIDYDSFDGATDWDWLVVKQDETNGDIKYTVQYLSGTWQDTSIVDVDGDVNGVYNYIDISSLDPATENEIRIVATLTDSGGTPYLEDWTVFALGAGPTIVDLVSFEAIGSFGKVLVCWETDSEINNAGFNVFRIEHPHYRFNKLNSALIPGLGNSAIGKKYRFWDNNVTDGITYYYILEDVEFDGKSTLHGPVEAHPGLDSDNEGMTDDWENYYGLNPYDPADALLDADADGITNLDEFIQGKNPTVSDIPPLSGEPDKPTPMVLPGGEQDGVKTIQSDDYGVVLELITSGFEIETKLIEDETYQIIKLPFSHGQTTEVGKPQVPVKGVLLGIPFDSAITIDLVSYEKEILSGYNLYPVPRIHWEEEQLTYEFVKDTNAYSRDRFYPGSLAEISPVGSLRGQDAGKLNVYPIQFNPVTGQLEFYKRIRLKVDFGKKAEFDQENIHKPPTPFETLRKCLFHNYRDIKCWKRRPRKHIGRDKFTPKSAYKISVNEEGIYRLTWQDLYDAGLNPYWLDPGKIKIYHRGNQIPIYMAGQRNGWFDDDDEDYDDYNDYIAFYAEAVNTRFTTTNIYWLVTDGSRGQRMKTKRSFGGRGQTPTSFLCDIHHEENLMYWMDIPDKGYVDDHWFFSDLLSAPYSVDFVIPLSDVADVEDEATLKIALQGISHGFSGSDHHIYIYLNGHLVDDTTWDGDIEYIRQLNVPQSYFVEGDNIITIHLPGDTGAEFDVVLANWFEVSYWRQLKAKENALKFNTQGQGRYSYKISNFTENDIEIFDITNPKKVERIVRSVIKKENGSYTVEFNGLLMKERNKNYLVLSSSGMNSPVSIVKDEPSNLRFRGNQADYIIITHEDFYDGILPLAKHRAKQGLSVKVVKVQDIYDEFNYGIFSPEAIKTFLEYTYSAWTEPAPTYVLLVGDGTYDYQDNEGLGCKNYVPTYMVHSLMFGETGSDNWFVCLDGEDDILPDMFIGRFPVYSVEQLDTIVSKTINYENAPSGDWTKKVTLVADNLEAVFVTISEGLTGYPPSGYQTNKIYLDNYAAPKDCKADIIGAINQGTLILNYVGHGSVVRWAHESILEISDIASLTNLDRLTFMSIMNCANGYFVYPPGFFNCIAEELLYSPSGGVVAILAPTGVSYPNIQEMLDKYLFESIFVEHNFCLGVATTQARLSVFENAGQSGENIIQTFPLFGDPALELKR